LFWLDIFQTGDTLYSLKDFADRFELSVLKTHSCQVNFDHLENFNQKILEIKLSDPVSAEQVLQDAKAGWNVNFINFPN
jgi:hypothetical protein